MRKPRHAGRAVATRDASVSQIEFRDLALEPTLHCLALSLQRRRLEACLDCQRLKRQKHSPHLRVVGHIAQSIGDAPQEMIPHDGHVWIVRAPLVAESEVGPAFAVKDEDCGETGTTFSNDHSLPEQGVFEDLGFYCCWIDLLAGC